MRDPAEEKTCGICGAILEPHPFFARLLRCSECKQDFDKSCQIFDQEKVDEQIHQIVYGR